MQHGEAGEAVLHGVLQRLVEARVLGVAAAAGHAGIADRREGLGLLLRIVLLEVIEDQAVLAAIGQGAEGLGLQPGPGGAVERLAGAAGVAAFALLGQGHAVREHQTLGTVGQLAGRGLEPGLELEHRRHVAADGLDAAEADPGLAETIGGERSDRLVVELLQQERQAGPIGRRKRRPVVEVRNADIDRAIQGQAVEREAVVLRLRRRRLRAGLPAIAQGQDARGHTKQRGKAAEFRAIHFLFWLRQSI